MPLHDHQTILVHSSMMNSNNVKYISHVNKAKGVRPLPITCDITPFGTKGHVPHSPDFYLIRNRTSTVEMSESINDSASASAGASCNAASIEESDAIPCISTCSMADATKTSKASLRLSLLFDEEEETKELIRRWEEEALSHFRNSAWEDVIKACKKVLLVPGQAKSNFDILYEIGYAHMRLGYYEEAAGYFMGAHRIDSQRVSLRLVMRDLRRKIRTGPWRNKKRSREDRDMGSSKSDQQKLQQLQQDYMPPAKRPFCPPKA